ncbi:MAG: hypothetical protein KJ063_02230 [Anaerolineae bacterium]|nr:hypothetical protein [Anaerolineae bacterium]
MSKKNTVKRYFIVNPAGAIHEVTLDHAETLLRKVGFRSATQAEVNKLNAAKGEQRFDAPICTPFKAIPAAIEVEFDDEDEVSNV